MIVFNIRREKYASSLIASGVANRWNREDEFVIYTAESISLAVLELLVHRSNIRLNEIYKVLHIKLDIESQEIMAIPIQVLPKNWRSIKSYPELQALGSDWYQNQKALVLKVPSVLVPSEHNYVINTKHPFFEEKVKLISVEDFRWDDRLF